MDVLIRAGYRKGTRYKAQVKDQAELEEVRRQSSCLYSNAKGATTNLMRDLNNHIKLRTELIYGPKDRGEHALVLHEDDSIRSKHSGQI